MNETMYACALACSYEGYQTPSGAYRSDTLLTNVTKLNVTRFPYEISRLAQDIAGGLIATMPSQKDLERRETGELILKYLRGSSRYTTEQRLMVSRLIENMTMSTGYLVEPSMEPDRRKHRK